VGTGKGMLNNLNLNKLHRTTLPLQHLALSKFVLVQQFSSFVEAEQRNETYLRIFIERNKIVKIE